MASMDTLDKLIPFAVFIFWIFSAVFRQNRKRPGAEKPTRRQSNEKKRPTVLGELRRALQTILEEFETPQGQPLPQAQPEEPSVPSTVDYSRDAANPERTVPEESAGEKRPAPVASAPEIPAATMPHTAGGRVGETSISATTLREGVIWSEILSPPPALRDQD